MSFTQLLFSAQGRSSRAHYWLYALVYFVLYGVAIGLDLLIGVYEETIGIGLFSGIVSLLAVVPGLAIVIKRCHDRNRSGWFLLLLLVPLVSLWAVIEVAFLKGTEGDNKYGPDPTASPLITSFTTPTQEAKSEGVKHVDLTWRFVFVWTAATFLGWVTGNTILQSLSPLFMSARNIDIPFSQVIFLGTMMIGVSIGIAQWLVLRWRISEAGWWILISAATWATIDSIFQIGAINTAVRDLLPGSLDFETKFRFFIATRAITRGIFLGFLQLIVLHRRGFKALLWPIACVLGFALTSFVTPLGASSPTGNILRSYSEPIVFGLFTGIAMTIVLWQSSSKKENSLSQEITT